MKWFYNLKISTKLIITFLLVAVIAAVVGFVGLINLYRISEADTLMYHENTLGISHSSEGATYYQRLRYNMAEMVLLKDDSLLEDYVSKFKSYMETIDNELDEYQKNMLDEEDHRIYDELTADWRQYKAYVQDIIEYAQKGQYDRAQGVLLGDSDAVGDAIRESFVAMVELNEREAMNRADSNDSLSNRAITLMIAIIAVGIIFAVLLGVFISRIISRPVVRIVSAAERLAAGDVDISLDDDHKDETGQLIRAFRNLVTSTREQALLVEKIADGDLTVDVPVRSEKDLLGRKLTDVG